MGRVIVWFSCGATSAVSAKIAVSTLDNVEVVYCDTGGEHPDNMRFLKDVGRWIDREVTILKNEKYKDHFDVFEKTRYLVGVNGARCTIELKKKMREQYQKADDVHIFGFSIEEQGRAKRLSDNFPELNLEFNLIDRGLSKPDCLALVEQSGIELPVMYKLGYSHNNCIGCVKGQMGYWNKIRKDFPEIFERMANLEREIGAAINKTYAGDGERKVVYLDELTPDMGNPEKEPIIDCSLFCEMLKEDLSVSNNKEVK